MSSEEATVNADGSATFQEPIVDNEPVGEEIPSDDAPPIDEEIVKEVAKGIDPAFYFLVVVVIVAALYYFLVYRKKSTAAEGDGFFSNLDGDKVCEAQMLGASSHFIAPFSVPDVTAFLVVFPC
jgi:hypothetical protein